MSLTFNFVNIIEMHNQLLLKRFKYRVFVSSLEVDFHQLLTRVEIARKIESFLHNIVLLLAEFGHFVQALLDFEDSWVLCVVLGLIGHHLLDFFA